MNIGKFSDTEIGSSYNYTVLVLEMNERVSKTDKPFMNFVFTDGTDKVQANFFDKSMAAMKIIGVDVGTVVDLTFNVKNYNGKKNYTIENIGLCADPAATVERFVASPPYPIDTMYEQLITYVKKSSGREYDDSLVVPSDDCSLTGLTVRILTKNKEMFCKSSAAHSIHHDIRGGLLYHTFRMVHLAYQLPNTYRKLNRELLVCGAALHDIGKLYELETDEFGSAEYSIDGRLFGHAVIGMELVSEEAAKGNYNKEEVRLLRHMIASHHGNLEFGAITTPATPEAFVLHEIDMIDSRMYIFEKELGKVDGGQLTDRVFALENSTLYNTEVTQK
ncbi:MAG: HD domain-containing protein [Saccharofermentans sp.]|nr:HD domain-containing protein [Saccharofermentans sp.]